MKLTNDASLSNVAFDGFNLCPFKLAIATMAEDGFHMNGKALDTYVLFIYAETLQLKLL